MLLRIRWAIWGGICQWWGQSVFFRLVEGQWVFQKDPSGYTESQGNQEIHDWYLVSRTEVQAGLWPPEEEQEQGKTKILVM